MRTKNVLGALVAVFGAFALALPPAASAAPSLDGGAAHDDVSIMACYDTSKAFIAERGYKYYPKGDTIRTTTACSDINIWANTGYWVRVCFVSGVSSCQKDYTWAPAGRWTVVATGVLDNTRFQFNFRDRSGDPLLSGRWAA
jgi:hypothetical protein